MEISFSDFRMSLVPAQPDTETRIFLDFKNKNNMLISELAVGFCFCWTKPGKVSAPVSYCFQSLY